MLKRPSEHRLTIEERVALVVAIAVAVGVHLAVFLGGSGIGYLAREEQKRERLMVIRRVRDVTPAPDIAVRVPDPRRVQVPLDPGSSGAAPSAPPKPEPQVSKRGTQPKAEITPKMEEDLQESLRKEQEEQAQQAQPPEAKTAEIGVNVVSVVTDLPAASFTVSGPAEYRGTGTFWIRRGAPAGTYRIAFSAVEGFGMPPPQTKELAEQGQIVFIGKYKRSTEVIIDSNTPGAQFTIFRPDGRPLEINRPGRVMIDDLPPGTYTAVFKDVPGHITPPPSSSNLAPGGKLSFYGNYQDLPDGRASASGETGGTSRGGTGTYGGGSGPGSGDGTGSGSGSGGRARVKIPSGQSDAGLDRRVQMVVTSYPRSRIDDNYDAIPYPEVIIRKSNFQQGWCQVYLVLSLDDRGEIRDVTVERPRREDRARFEPLIKAVESAVRAWDYDRVKSEVHVDVRFYVE